MSGRYFDKLILLGIFYRIRRSCRLPWWHPRWAVPYQNTFALRTFSERSGWTFQFTNSTTIAFIRSHNRPLLVVEDDGLERAFIHANGATDPAPGDTILLDDDRPGQAR
jgi:hypothetical protein